MGARASTCSPPLCALYGMHHCAADPATNTAYMALTRVDKGMLKGDPMDGIGPDHVQLEANPCGVVMELKLDDSFSATSAKVSNRYCCLGLSAVAPLPHSLPTMTRSAASFALAECTILRLHMPTC